MHRLQGRVVLGYGYLVALVPRRVGGPDGVEGVEHGVHAGTAHGSPLPTGEDTPARVAAPKRRSGGKAGGGTLKARYPGRCRCGTSYAAGTTIAKNGTGWGHVECAEA